MSWDEVQQTTGINFNCWGPVLKLQHQSHTHTQCELIHSSTGAVGEWGIDFFVCPFLCFCVVVPQTGRRPRTVASDGSSWMIPFMSQTRSDKRNGCGIGSFSLPTQRLWSCGSVFSSSSVTAARRKMLILMWGFVFSIGTSYTFFLKPDKYFCDVTRRVYMCVDMSCWDFIFLAILPCMWTPTSVPVQPLILLCCYSGNTKNILLIYVYRNFNEVDVCVCWRERERDRVCVFGGCISRPCNLSVHVLWACVCVWTKLVALMVEVKCLLICTLRATLSLNARALLF